MTNKFPGTCVVCGKPVAPGEGTLINNPRDTRLHSKLAVQHAVFCVKGPKPNEPK